ncbi:hypothetical protein SmphiM12_351 [Sinorhizobium phage phiM12]|uniref:Uncharacterized protein n=1 Tax=Sinorhizobium phage phiM12 TaxID=1357423 RepID=A0A068NYJ4_9CAUD|nr:hypothetical protein AB690_gp243 [Sinorhizobium phage phiM12]AIF27787.1 hypothetical protein SmphiM12_351 [Sinorhizobium phage phiM12]
MPVELLTQPPKLLNPLPIAVALLASKLRRLADQLTHFNLNMWLVEF